MLFEAEDQRQAVIGQARGRAFSHPLAACIPPLRRPGTLLDHLSPPRTSVPSRRHWQFTKLLVAPKLLLTAPIAVELAVDAHCASLCTMRP